MNAWQPLIDITILLLAALVLGTLAEWLRQHAIVGYLIAGALVGPHGLNLVTSNDTTHLIAELGVALLLFTIGLEFSVDKVRKLGRIALLGGSAQIVITAVVGLGLAFVLDMDAKAAVVVGLMLAMSSTATVIRLLRDRAEVDAAHGRNAIGVLLMQDAAVVPMLVVISAMAGGGGPIKALGTIGLATLAGAAMIGGFYLISKHVVPRAFGLSQWSKNRELPVLLAIVLALGASIIAHELNLSPAIGAFVAGLLLGGSPFAVTIRSDITALRTVLVTMFFAAIGMLGEPAWVAANIGPVAAVVVLVVVVKAGVVLAIMHRFKQSIGISLATGICLAQVGEFSFVIAQIAMGSELIDEHTFRLTVASTIITLFLTPYLVRSAPAMARMAERMRKSERVPEADRSPSPANDNAPIVIVGFGPAGQRVAEALLADHKARMLVIDANPRNVKIAQSYGLKVQVGDATRIDVLEHAEVHHAATVVVTLPAVDATRQIIHLTRQLNPDASILVRARYHVFRWELQFAGADVVVDEEDEVGMKLAQEIRKMVEAAK